MGKESYKTRNEETDAIESFENSRKLLETTYKALDSAFQQSAVSGGSFNSKVDGIFKDLRKLLVSVRKINMMLQGTKDGSANSIAASLQKTIFLNEPFFDFICFTSSSSLFDQRFHITNEYDWRRKLYLQNKIEVESIRSTDPWTRNEIRKSNLRFMTSISGDLMGLLNSVAGSKHVKIEILRIGLEFGVFCSDHIEKVLNNAVNRLPEANADDTEQEKKPMQKEPEDHTLINILTIIILSIVQINDQMVIGKQEMTRQEKDILKRDASRSEDREFAFFFEPKSRFEDSTYFVKVKKNIYEKLLSDGEKLKVHMRNPVFVDRFNILMMMLCSFDGDVYLKSVDLLIKDFTLVEKSFNPLRAIETIEVLKALNYLLVESDQIEKPGERTSLLAKVSQLTESLLSMQDSPEYLYSFSLHNGVHLALRLVLGLASFQQALGGQDCRSAIMRLVRAIGKACTKSSSCMNHLFQEREWEAVLLLLKVLPIPLLLMFGDIFAQQTGLPISNRGRFEELVSVLMTYIGQADPRSPAGPRLLAVEWQVGFLSVQAILQKLRNHQLDDEKHMLSLLTQQRLYSMTVEVALPSLLEEQLADPPKETESFQYEPVLLDRDAEGLWDYFLRPPQRSDEALLTKSLKWEVMCKIIEATNETLLYSKACLRSKPKPDQPLESIHTKLEYLNSMDRGLVFIKEIVKLYTRASLMEYAEYRETMHSVARDSVQLASHIHESHTNVIKSIIEDLNNFKGMRFSSKNRDLNISYVLEALLPMCYKAFKTIEQEIEDEALLARTHIHEIFSCLKDNREIIMRMIGKEDLISSLSRGMFQKINCLGEEVRRDEEEDVDAPPAVSLAAIQEQAQVIEELYATSSEFSRFAASIKAYSRSEVQFSRTTHRGDEEFSSRCLAYLENLGCSNLSILKLKMKKFRNPKDENYLQAEDGTTEEELLKSKAKQRVSKSQVAAVIKKIKPSWLANDLYLRLSSYKKMKHGLLNQPSSAFYEIMNEGADKDTDLYYKRLFTWIFNYISHKVDSIARSAEGLPYQRQDRHSEERSYQPREAHKLLVRDQSLVSWLVCLETMLKVQTARSKSILDRLFFSGEKSKHLMEEDEELSGRASADGPDDSDEENDYVPMEQEHLDHTAAGHQLDQIDLAKGKKIMLFVFDCLLTLQVNIKDQIFDSQLPVHFKYYFILSNFVKSLAEKNSEEFKKYIGSFVIPPFEGSEKPDIDDGNEKLVKASASDLYFVDEYYRGLVFDKKKPKLVPGSIVSTSKLSDREDLLLYSIVTVNTLAEFFNGPCKDNQNKFIKKIIPLLKPMTLIYKDIYHLRYIYQEALVRLICSLFEGENKNKIDEYSRAVEHRYVYDLIVKYMSHFWKYWLIEKQPQQYEMIRKNMKGTIEKDEYFAPTQTQQILHYYKKYTEFSSHPVINICTGLLYFIKVMSTKNKEYLKSYKDLLFAMCRKYGKLWLVINQQTLKEFYMQNSTSNDNGRNNVLVYFHFVNLISSSIEVNTETEKNIIIHYQKVPKSLFLTENTKSKFRKDADISDTSRKLLDLMMSSEDFIIEMNNNIKIYRMNPYLSLATNNNAFTFVIKLLWILGLFMNLTALSQWSFSAADNKISMNSVSSIIVLVLNCLIIFIAVFELLIWFWSRYKELLSKIKKQSELDEKNSLIDSADDSSGKKKKSVSYFMIPLPMIPRKSVVMVYLSLYYSVLKHTYPQCYLMHVLFALLSFSKPFFITLHLFTIIYISETSKYVIRSIIVYFKPKLITIIMVVFIVYNYTVIIAYYFSDTFQTGVTEGIPFCTNLRGCFSYVLDYGLRLGGGVGEGMIAFSYDEKRFAYKFFLQFTFYLAVNFILLNIFFGIIVDTFKQLRSLLDIRENDQKNVCFICGFSRKDFERKEKSFEFHIKHEHNVWNYIDFITYLKSKHESEYTGNEYKLAEKFRLKRIDWFPIQKTIYLGTLPSPRRRRPRRAAQRDREDRRDQRDGQGDEEAARKRTAEHQHPLQRLLQQPPRGPVLHRSRARANGEHPGR